MIYDRILVRYGELSIKGKNRKFFKNALHRAIRFKLAPFTDLAFEVTRDRFYILLNGTDAEVVAEKLGEVFGLQSFSLAAKTENDIDAIKQLALAVVQEQYPGPTKFKVETKRANKDFFMQSGEISRAVGGYLLANTQNLKVDVHQPDMILNVEVRREGSFVMAGATRGLGGFPVGSSGKGLLMISGGIDSPVAGYLMQKRGVEIEAIHFASPPYTSDRALQKVVDLLEKVAVYAAKGEIRLHIVPFTKLQEEIHKQMPDAYEMTIMRRMMYRVAEGVAKERGIMVMANGESLGQVASQTLASMNAINAVTSMPIIRPVATYDKLEIIDIAHQIDTYETSILPFEDCCTIFVPKSPATNPTQELCEKYEARFDFSDLVADCIRDVETRVISVGNTGPSDEVAAEIDDLL
ncbi:MAG: tRNA 4-thiouridine(8) synthase ThiI [Turicibacter sp.]|nr:tRNA 4-thiouridine(8) synthase ThiI [Turicibacter sp.]